MALGLLYGILVTAESAMVSTGIADVAEPAYLGRTMALQSAAGFAAGALGPAVFGAMLDWAPTLGASPDSRWLWAFGVLGLVALAGPLAVGFKDFSPRKAGSDTTEFMAEKPRKLRVGVVFGGRSGEHEVSLAGAASVMAAMDRARFELVPIGIAKDGRWLMGGDPLRALAAEAAQLALASGDPEAHTKHELLERATAQDTGTSLMRMETSESLPPGLRDRLDVVLVLLHGPQGEDGTVQGLLQLAGVPYTGAGVLASAVGMDKVAMKDLFRAHGLPIVEYAVVRRHDWEREPAAIARGIATEIGFPCFVKPANLGSSVGISKVKAAEDLPAAIDLAARHDRRIIVERAIQAREVEVAVLGNDEPRVSVPGEVCFPGEWYDYDTKYGAGQTTFKVPAPLPPEVTEEIRSLALRAFRATDCAGMARVDFFIEGDRRVLVNEINTIPGFTATSAYPRLWEASGIPYPELIARLIDLALERR